MAKPTRTRGATVGARVGGRVEKRGQATGMARRKRRRRREERPARSVCAATGCACAISGVLEGRRVAQDRQLLPRVVWWAVLARVAVRGVGVVKVAVASTISMLSWDGQRGQAVSIRGSAAPFLRRRHVVVVRLGLARRLEMSGASKAKGQRRSREAPGARLSLLVHAAQHVRRRRNGQARRKRAWAYAGHVELIAFSRLRQARGYAALEVCDDLCRRVAIQRRVGYNRGQ